MNLMPRGRLVLLAEDNLDDIALTKTVIEESGCSTEVEVVRSGREAMELLRRVAADPAARRPDLIVLDLYMPGADGREILRFLHGHERLRAIPTLVLTGSQDEEDRAVCKRLGASDYAIKPCSYAEMRRIADRIAPILN